MISALGTGDGGVAQSRTIAALFVETNGAYFNLPGVDPYDIHRNAMTYAGPWPVVAHPPCERWGRYWHGGPSVRVRKTKGDDGGCFSFALSAVRTWGGVLEHPADSHAWAAHDLNTPPYDAGWIVADFEGGWTCRVEQGHYGHAARKGTWLYAVGTDLPSLAWGKSSATMRLDAGFHSTAERARAKAAGWVAPPRLSRAQRLGTPEAFRDQLIAMARSVRPRP